MHQRLIFPLADITLLEICPAKYTPPQSRHSRAGGNPLFKSTSQQHSRKNMQPTVYIMANQKRGTLYVGVTSNLIPRVWHHKSGATEGFSQRYGTKSLVYYEQHESMESAILREKQLKKWRRQWKINLIYQHNPDWNDLWDSICGASSG